MITPIKPNISRRPHWIRWLPTQPCRLHRNLRSSPRLLDWSTNPLAALFFASDGGEGADGFVYAMDAKGVIAEGAVGPNGRQIYFNES